MPGTFQQKILDIHKQKGQQWLDDLPKLISQLEKKWHIQVFEEMPELSYNHISTAVRHNGFYCALKLGYPSREINAEIEVLRLYAGNGAVHLLESDESLGAILLERALPGTPLRKLPDDDQATVIAAGLMKRLVRKAPEVHDFKTAEQWANDLSKARKHFGGGTGPLPVNLFEMAESNFRDLLGSTRENYLLHGDLHHGNILQANRDGWLAIDPKGVIGDLSYQCAPLILNTLIDDLPDADARQALTRRVDLLASELNLEADRIRGWAAANAILSGWWSIEDHGRGYEGAVRMAELLV